MSIFFFRFVFVYIIHVLAALRERFSDLSKFASCITEFIFGKAFFYKHTQALAVLLK